MTDDHAHGAEDGLGTRGKEKGEPFSFTQFLAKGHGFLATVGTDDTARVWEVESGEEIALANLWTGDSLA